MFLMISTEVPSLGIIDGKSFHNFTSFFFICFELQIAIYVLTLFSECEKRFFVYNRKPRRRSRWKTENLLKPTQIPYFPSLVL